MPIRKAFNESFINSKVEVLIEQNLEDLENNKFSILDEVIKTNKNNINNNMYFICKFKIFKRRIYNFSINIYYICCTYDYFKNSYSKSVGTISLL